MQPERALLKQSSTIILGKTLLFKSNTLIRFTKNMGLIKHDLRVIYHESSFVIKFY